MNYPLPDLSLADLHALDHFIRQDYEKLKKDGKGLHSDEVAVSLEIYFAVQKEIEKRIAYFKQRFEVPATANTLPSSNTP